LQLELHRAQREVLVERLIGGERGGEQPPIGQAVGKLEIMALAQGSLLLFFLGRGSLILFLAGVFSFSLGEAPMDGAAIFELLLALLDGGFLDFEFGESRFAGADGQTGSRQRGSRRCQRQTPRSPQRALIVLQEPPPQLSPAKYESFILGD